VGAIAKVVTGIFGTAVGSTTWTTWYPVAPVAPAPLEAPQKRYIEAFRMAGLR